MKRIILASGSPRRKALLDQIGISYSVIVSPYEEKTFVNQEPRQFVQEQSYQKAKAVSQDHPDAIVIGADTIVVCDGAVLEKPKSEIHARDILEALSGKKHTVITGFSVVHGQAERAETKSVETSVYFKTLSKEDIDWYIGTGEPMDKAGAYGIQGKGALFVTKIDGDYFNVVGLPVALLMKVLSSFGVGLS